jgi:hypothetical protein
MVISAWWVLWAFMGGGTAGFLLAGMMFVTSAEDEHVGPRLGLRGIDSPDLPRAINGPV